MRKHSSTESQPFARKRFASTASLHNAMATRIQRFWYAQARWATTRRMSAKMIQAGAGFVGNHLERPTLESYVNALAATNTTKWLARWLRRVSGVDIEAEHILPAFLLSMHWTHLALPRVDLTSPLLRSSHQLVTCLDTRMRSQDHPPKKLAIANLIREYVDAFKTWRAAHEVEITRRMMCESLACIHEALYQRHSASAADVIARSTKKYAILLVKTQDQLKRAVLSSREVKVLRSLTNSVFWGAGNLSVFRIMHELLMNEHFEPHADDVFPKFFQKYTPVPTSPLVITELLIDLRAVVIWSIRAPELLSEMCTILDIENMAWPEDIHAIACRLIPLIIRAINPDPTTEANLQARWVEIQEEGITSPRRTQIMLNAMLWAAKTLRMKQAMEELEHCRRNIRRHSTGYHTTHINHLISHATLTKRTAEWLQRILEQYSGEELRRVAYGDPYALLGLHDHSIVAFALEGNLEYPPETLIFDVQRLRIIRTNMGWTDESGRHTAYATLLRLIETSQPSENPLLTESAEMLRNIIFISRFQHGETIARLARDIAKQLLTADTMLGILAERLTDVEASALE